MIKTFLYINEVIWYITMIGTFKKWLKWHSTVFGKFPPPPPHKWNDNREVKISLRQRVRERNFGCWHYHFLCSSWVHIRYRCRRRVDHLVVYKSVTKTTAIFNCSRTRCRSEILTSLLLNKKMTKLKNKHAKTYTLPQISEIRSFWNIFIEVRKHI